MDSPSASQDGLRMQFVPITASGDGVENYMKDRVTLRELAKLCGTSVTAVSRALSGKDGVSEETRARVIRVASERHYRPNLLARNMRSQTSNLIGIVVGDIRKHFFVELLRGVEMAARTASMHVLVANADEDFPTELEAVETFLAYNCRGIILCPVLSDSEYLSRLSAESMKVVIIDRPVDEGLGFSQIITDNRQGSRRLVEHLLEHGHERIAFIGSSFPSTVTLKDRYLGYVDVLNEHGISLEEGLVRQCRTKEEAVSATEYLLARKNRPTAFFIADESLAIDAVSCIMRLGFSIPEDVSVVIFGNPQWAVFPPGFTGLDRDVQVMGEQAVHLLIEQLHSKAKPQCLTVESELQCRGSVGSPRVR